MNRLKTGGIVHILRRGWTVPMRATVGMVIVGAVAFETALLTPSAAAFEFETGNADVKARWDNTIKYSIADRLKDRSSILTSDPNLDDGDRNFKKGGLISNRVDLLSEFDVTYRNVGMRVSGAGWYDDVYNRSNHNNSIGIFGPGTSTVNAVSVPPNEFTKAVRNLHGQKAELLDAFVFGKGELGDVSGSVRAGKHSLLYGESLFFGNNGIAGAQAPVDIIKLQSVPSTPFKELIRPVNQFSGQLQFPLNLTVGGYYKFHWERDRLPGVGSYFSTTDILDVGAERILAGPNTVIPRGAPFFLSRIGDNEAKNSGQWGAQVRFRPESQDTEYGLYAANFHSRSPVVYTYAVGFNPVSGHVGDYRLVFPEDIKVYGASLTTSVGPANVGAEISYRHNMPLVAQGGAVAIPSGVAADNRNNPRYPVGNTAHAQISFVSLLVPTALWQGGTFLGEIAWNRRLEISKNASALDTNATRDASAARITFEPAYFQVLNGLDISVPVGVGYGLSGKSSVFNPGFSVYHSGDVSIGLKGDYLRVWKVALNYTHFIGSDTPTTVVNAGVRGYSYGQALGDRDFISLSLQRTF
jgi:hypothetical protein